MHVCFFLSVSVLNEQWCWKMKSLEIEIIDKDLTNVDFVQTGFMLSASLSHSITLVSIQLLHHSIDKTTCSCWTETESRISNVSQGFLNGVFD